MDNLSDNYSTDDTFYSKSTSEDGSFNSVATQPFNESLAANIGHLPKKCSLQIWGQLVPTMASYRCFSLHSESMVCIKEGNALDKNNVDLSYVLKADEFSPEIFSQLSRQHFAISRADSDNEKFDVFITDLSSNGTFVNGEKVGKGKSRPLVNRDCISLVNVAYGGFTFLLVAKESNESNFEVPREVARSYIVGNKISHGTTGSVYIGYHRKTHQKFALKFISKTVSFTAVMDEVTIMKSVSHPNIINFKKLYSSDTTYVISMELALGMDLFNYVFDDYMNKSFNEDDAKLQFYQIVSGVSYLHKKKVCHRDLKLENILLNKNNRRSLVKIADFGLSKIAMDNVPMMSYVGTPNYIAPEVLRNQVFPATSMAYDLRVDMWSLGCILYSLLCGSPAFFAEKDEDLKFKILMGDYYESNPVLEKVSIKAKHLVKKLLKVDPEKRLTAEEALLHAWFKDKKMLRDYQKLLEEYESNLDPAVPQISKAVQNLVLWSQSPTKKSRKRRYSAHSDDDNIRHKKVSK